MYLTLSLSSTTDDARPHSAIGSTLWHALLSAVWSSTCTWAFEPTRSMASFRRANQTFWSNGDVTHFSARHVELDPIGSSTLPRLMALFEAPKHASYVYAERAH